MECDGAFACVSVELVNETAMPDYFECQGLHSCSNNVVTYMESNLCESYLGCAACTFIGTNFYQWTGFDCYGVGSCAYQLGIETGRGYMYIYPDAMLAAYSSTFTTSGSGYPSWNEVYTYGLGSMYGSSLTCRGNDTCWIECEGAHGCYCMTVICESNATCIIYGCNATRHIMCPKYEGDGKWIHERAIYPYNYINMSEEETPELYVDYQDFSFYRALEYWIYLMIEEFIPSEEEILNLDVGSYYDDRCLLNCGNFECASNEIWSSFDSGSGINSSWLTGNNESNLLCFSGAYAGYYTQIDFDDDNNYDLVFDAESAGI